MMCVSLSLASSVQKIFPLLLNPPLQPELNAQLWILQTHEFSTAMIVHSTILIQHRNQRWLGTSLQDHASV